MPSFLRRFLTAAVVAVCFSAQAQVPDPCAAVAPRQAAALVTLNQADVSAKSMGPGRCYFEVTPSLGGAMDVELRIYDLGTHAAAVERMQQDGPFQFGKQPVLVQTNDPGDRVYDVLAPNGNSVEAVHGQYKVELSVPSPEDGARAHPSWEYRLERTALEAAGATILPSPGMAEDPVLPMRGPAPASVRDETVNGAIPWYFHTLGYLWILGPVIAAFLLYRVFLGPYLLRSKLSTTGLPGMALVESVADTATTVNNNPQVRYQVMITPGNGGAPYRASTKVLVSRLIAPASQIGKSLPVKIDPKNPQSFIFV